LSSVQRNSSVPLSVATVKKVMNGFAAIALMQVGAEDLGAVVGAHEQIDDIARIAAPVRCADIRFPSHARSAS